MLEIIKKEGWSFTINVLRQSVFVNIVFSNIFISCSQTYVSRPHNIFD